jgi:uncharacterized membrane protein
MGAAGIPQGWGEMGSRDPRVFVVLVLLSSVAGFLFSAVSAYDSTAHLDRQVHGVHCSYLLGLGTPDTGGESGCRATLMSPYSSVFRQSIWGGVPIAVPSMSVFAFIFFVMAALGLSRRQTDPQETGFLLAAALVPLLSSLVMGYVSFVTLEAACKLCIGIYVSSAALFAGAYGLWALSRARARQTMSSPRPEEGGAGDRHGEGRWTPRAMLAAALAAGFLFVAVPMGTYAAAAPDFSAYAGSCGSLARREDPQQALMPLGPQDRPVEMIEVIDPLCASCGAFERRLNALSLSAGVSRRILLFPLDKECNWMIGESVHPGACAVSEAVLCSGERAREVLDWATQQREAILEKARGDPGAVGRLVSSRFPRLSDCVNSARTRARLNQALRWAVRNRLQVLTPQVFVNGLRLCDEDTDLGLDYSLPRLIALAGSSPAGERGREDRTAGADPVKQSISKRTAPGVPAESHKAGRAPVESEKAKPVPGQPSPGVVADAGVRTTAVEARDGAAEPVEMGVMP